MTRPFGDEGDLFKYSLFLVLCNRLVTCVLAVGCLLVRAFLTPINYLTCLCASGSWQPASFKQKVMCLSAVEG